MRVKFVFISVTLATTMLAQEPIRQISTTNDAPAQLGEIIISKTTRSAGYKVDTIPAQDVYKEAMRYYTGGKGYKQDRKRAIKMLETAAQQGNYWAMYQLGNCYRYGNGTGMNKKKATEYWQQAADRGCIEAKYELGNAYYNGEGIKRNYDKAVALFSDGAKAEHHASLYMLGECYHNGKGVKKDKKLALEYWNKAATKGNHKAKDRLKELD